MNNINLIMYCEEAFSLFSGEYSKSRFGGAGLQMYFLANEFAKNPNINVSFLFLNHDANALNHPRIRFVNMPNLISRGAPGLSRIINNRRKAKLVSNQPRNSILFSTMAMNARFLQQLASELGAHSVLRVASDTDVSAPRNFSLVEQQKILDSLANINHVVVQTQKQKDTLFESRGKLSTIISNGIPVSNIKVAPLDERSHILWVSSSQDIKQPWYFLDLAKAFPQEKFVMLMPKLIEDVSDRILRGAEDIPNIEICTEQISFDKTTEYFRRAKMFVNTSLVEGFPNTFLQAAQCGTPIVSLSVNPDDVLGNYHIGSSAGGDIWMLRQVVDEYLLSKSKWEIASENGVKYINRHHNIETAAEKYLEIFNSLVERNKE